MLRGLGQLLLLARVAGSEEGADSPLSGTTALAPSRRTPNAVEDVATVVEVEALSRADRLSICAHHLTVCGKKLSPQQTDAYIDNAGAASPLWQALAMSRLRRLAGFETLSEMIAALPPCLDTLIGEELSAAEAAAGVHAVRGALLACVLVREGLADGEALHLTPLLARVVAAAEAETPEAAVDARFEACEGDALAALRLEWSRLSAAIDPFLAPVAAGAPRILRASHGVVRAAIVRRYGGNGEGAATVRVVRRAIANFFESRHASATIARRRSDWRCEGVQIHWEGPPESCAHCNAQIESAYGDPDADEAEPV
jgi:hypothetical protein